MRWKTYSLKLAATLCLLTATQTAHAWDYTTTNPCDTPVAHTPGADIASPAHTPAHPPITTDIDVYRHIPAGNHHALGETHVGSTTVTPEGVYVDVLGEEIATPPPATSESAGTVNATPAPATTASTGCR